MNRRKAIQKTGLLAGATFAVPTLISLLESCQKSPRITWTPLFFEESEAIFITSIVDELLPRTNTPGALDVKVDLFIDKVVAKTFDKPAQEKFRGDIAKFEENCQENYGSNFEGLNGKEKKQILIAAESNDGKYSRSVWGTAVGDQEEIGFYRSLKTMVIWAYFTSEEIGKNVLNYDPIPQEYIGCMPLSDVGNRYSL